MNRFLHILLALPFAALANVPDADRGAPGAQPPSLSVQPPGSGTRNPEPGARNPQPATKNEEPGTKNQEPRTKNSSWSPQPFSHYQPILDRKPFGVPPPAPVGPAAAEAAAPPPAFVSKIALCSINRTPAGPVAVGFVDSSQNPPKSYYVLNGDNSDGFAVLEASFENESATLEKDGVRIDLKMGKGPTVAAAAPGLQVAPAIPHSTRILQPHAPPPSVAAITQAMASARANSLKLRAPGDSTFWPLPSNVKAIDSVLKMGITNESYVDRLRKRREEVMALQATQNVASIDKAAEEKMSAAFERFLRTKNMDLIRKGEGGLGFQLTPEEDAQLVNEGALPPQK
jgi:hypothetical protein